MVISQSLRSSENSVCSLVFFGYFGEFIVSLLKAFFLWKNERPHKFFSYFSVVDTFDSHSQ